MRPRSLRRWILPAVVVIFSGLYYLGAFTSVYWPPTFATHSERIDTTRMTTAQWYAVWAGAPRDSVIVLPLKAGGAATERATFPVRDEGTRLQTVLDALLATFALVLAGYLGYRRPSIMVGAFVGFVIGVCSISGIYPWLSALPQTARLLLAVVPVSLCAIFPNFALASFAIRFPGNVPSAARSRAIRWVDLTVAGAFVIEVLHNANLIWPAASGNKLYTTLYLSMAALLTLVASVCSLIFAKRSDRSRVGIVFAAIMLGGVGYAISGVLQIQLGVALSHGSLYYDVSVAVVALAVAYAILKHRVFDLAFVLNRTLVYAGTSAIAVVILAALEFLLERYLAALTHVEDVLIEFGIAMIVIVSARVAHGYVDRAIDVVLFRKRHEDEQALRRFAHEAAYITDRETLLERTGEALEQHADASAVTIATSGRFDENDPAIVALRAWHKPLDLTTVRSVLHGDWAYPMVARGRLVGALVLGPKRSGETYAPDESDAIAQIAHSVAGSLDVMEAQSDSTLARIENLLQTLPERLAEQMRSLEAH